MSDLSFLLDADETAVLELKLGQYLVGPKGDTGQAGPPGPEGQLDPDDVALIEKAVTDSQAAANASAGSAQASANSATSAASSATQAGAARDAASASALAASQSADLASAQATSASGSATAASTSATNAKTSETNAAAWEALAKDWATKLGATVDGTDYSAKYYAQSCVASASAANNSATAAAGSATAASGSATAAATSASNAKTSETNAANSAAQAANKVSKAGDTMTGALNISTGAATALLTLQSNAGQYKQIWFGDGPSVRWTISEQGSAESGGNVGADFAIDRYNDSGAWLNTCVQILRATGRVFVNSTADGVVSQAGSGNQFRAIGTNGNYGAIFRNDDTNCYLLSTNAGDPWGTWNAYRPLSWNLANGQVNISSGQSVVVNGTTTVNGDLWTVGNMVINAAANLIFRSYGQVQFAWGGLIYSDSSTGNVAFRTYDGTNYHYCNFDASGGLHVSGQAYIGNATISTDGNIYMTWANNWLSNVMAGQGRASNTNGVQTETAAINNTNGLIDAGSPWVMCGIRVDAWKGPSGDCVGSMHLRLTQSIQT